MAYDNSPAIEVILLFGLPGSGKGTWGKILGMMPGFYHLSTGDMFRMLDTESELGERVIQIMSAGELVPDDIVFDLMRRNLRHAEDIGRFNRARDRLVLDGFPRTPRQAEALMEIATIKCVLLLDCDNRELLINRLRRRAVLENRADDASEAVLRRRFEIYDREISTALAKVASSLIERIDVSRQPVRILCTLSQALDKRLG